MKSEAHMTGMVNDIVETFTKATGEPPRHQDTPRPSGKWNLDDYRSIVETAYFLSIELPNADR
jgi:hypothetical protein